MNKVVVVLENLMFLKLAYFFSSTETLCSLNIPHLKLSFNVISMSLQMIASLKCQYAELLSDIGFIKADLTARKIGRLVPRTGDGVLAATGEEVLYWGGVAGSCL